MEWLIYLGISSLLTYELIAAFTGISHTISEWFWRLFKRKPWTRWPVLAVLVIFTLHIVFELWGYGLGGPLNGNNPGSVYRSPVDTEEPCPGDSGTVPAARMDRDLSLVGRGAQQ